MPVVYGIGDQDYTAAVREIQGVFEFPESALSAPTGRDG
jgi:hypothetical protein